MHGAAVTIAAPYGNSYTMKGRRTKKQPFSLIDQQRHKMKNSLLTITVLPLLCVSFLHIGNKGNSINSKTRWCAKWELQSVRVCLFLDCLVIVFNRNGKGQIWKTPYIYYNTYSILLMEYACLLNFLTFCMRSVYCWLLHRNSRNGEYKYFSWILFCSVGGSFWGNE